MRVVFALILSSFVKHLTKFFTQFLEQNWTKMYSCLKVRISDTKKCPQRIYVLNENLLKIKQLLFWSILYIRFRNLWPSCWKSNFLLWISLVFKPVFVYLIFWKRTVCIACMHMPVHAEIPVYLTSQPFGCNNYFPVLLLMKPYVA